MVQNPSGLHQNSFQRTSPLGPQMELRLTNATVENSDRDYLLGISIQVHADSMTYPESAMLGNTSMGLLSDKDTS